jgi:AcrR family transcriptional regulator
MSAAPDAGPERRATGRHRRPGTAVSDKGRARSEEILDAATRLLLDEGYAQLSIRKIAAGAGIRAGNLQYYYATKQDVVRALLERYLARSMQAVGQRVAATAGSAESRLRACIDGLLDDQDSAGACRIFWEIWALAARDRAVASATRRFYVRYRDGLADILRAVSPRLGRALARRRATLLVATIEGLTVFRIGTDRQALEEPALARELRCLALQLARETHP